MESISAFAITYTIHIVFRSIALVVGPMAMIALKAGVRQTETK